MQPGLSHNPDTPPPAPEGMVASVIIPARNEEHTVGACLEGLARQDLDPAVLEVIVVISGTDRTREVVIHAGSDKFGRLEVVSLDSGNKNAALRAGCARATGEVVLLVDADTVLAPEAVARFVEAVRRNSKAVFNGALIAREGTWVSRYCELNRKLTKELRFDGNLSGGVIAVARAALAPSDLPELFPDAVGAADDFCLGLALRRRGWRIAYVREASASTLFPRTLSGLLISMLRNRRGVMAVLPLRETAPQAAKSTLLLFSLPASLVAAPYSAWWSLACAAPLLLHVVSYARGVREVFRRGLGDYRRGIAGYLALDLTARGLKLWAFLERLAGRPAPQSFRGERPGAAMAAREI
jgi:cellulose synthase/poly-beta-1,6-N-acetylglucosamine synthase-like glycosyltransferase